jgi:hypothetical protein
LSSCRRVRLLGLVLALCLPGLAAAYPLKSRYTTIELKSCQQVKRQRDGGAWICPGLPRFPVYIAEADRRQFLSFGRNAETHRAASQTLAAFNTLFDEGRSRPTIEWRFVRREGRDVPYAAIVRYITGGGAGRGRVLIVSKVGEAQSCHVAYIDALANPEAIGLAREVADKEARAFDCGQQPRQVGATGKSPM